MGAAQKQRLQAFLSGNLGRHAFLAHVLPLLSLTDWQVCLLLPLCACQQVLGCLNVLWLQSLTQTCKSVHTLVLAAPEDSWRAAGEALAAGPCRQPCSSCLLWARALHARAAPRPSVLPCARTPVTHHLSARCRLQTCWPAACGGHGVSMSCRPSCIAGPGAPVAQPVQLLLCSAMAGSTTLERL